MIDTIGLQQSQLKIVNGHLVKLLVFTISKSVEREEITAATLYNFVKAIRLFCEISDVPISWKKITRGLVCVGGQ
jgi:hypothetical protein